MTVGPITTELIRAALTYASEEMGIALRNSSYSPNIRERMDHSCSIFDSKRRLVAQAEHIPVHLGSLPFAVNSTLEHFSETLEEGDDVLVNDPSLAGTHLPDLTLIKPVFYEGRLSGYVANKAHHSDIGGKSPGSMPSDSTDLHEEGLIIEPVKLVRSGAVDNEVLNMITRNVRTPKITIGDLKAQIAANNTGERRLIEVIERYGADVVQGAVGNAMAISEKRLRKSLEEMLDGEFQAEDYLEDTGITDKPCRIKVKITKIGGSIKMDYTGTDEQVKAPVNAPLGVTVAGVYYTIKCVTDPTIPNNEGFSRPIEIYAPKGSLLNPVFPAPVAGGNVETSQRNVDTLLKAFSQIIPEKVPAAGQGTMNNITVGGEIPTSGHWSFYETIGGGMGASSEVDGADGVHVHMTNTMNTPIETIEVSYPLRLIKYELREDSGGAGKKRGGVGIERSWVLLEDSATVSILAERNKIAPWGLQGGREAAKGEFSLIGTNGTKRRVNSKSTLKIQKGDILVIRTPGGGGYGDPLERDPDAVLRDVMNELVSVEAAEREYGVAIDIKQRKINWNLTYKLRQSRR
jgi:N-methylhydantoinase B